MDLTGSSQRERGPGWFVPKGKWTTIGLFPRESGPERFVLDEKGTMMVCSKARRGPEPA